MTLETRLLPLLHPLVKNKAARALLASLFSLPHVLFWILASSHVFHWWVNFAPPALDRAMLQALFILSTLAALSFGFASLFFWRWYCHITREQRSQRSHLIGTYSLIPCIYTLDALWAYENLQYRSAIALADCAFALGVLHFILLIVLQTLTTLRKLKSRTMPEHQP